MLRLCSLVLLALATPLAARDSLGIYGQWGAFRDDQEPRCYAVAVPTRTSGESDFAAFAAVSNWPSKRVRSQIHFRTSREIGEDARVTLRVGRDSFTLTGSANNAWAENPEDDAAIVSAMRSAATMVLTTRGADGRRFTNSYDLTGVSSAIDAAGLGCTGR
ncbi:invasion associated locus B family protein [Aurantiacibacter suaedae]|uniref:invasion associated locus B family protein n=1 Tax=Aurantiacibacter suaedae TaxID=2545755 RepID=UPI0010F6F403|nr:invasion associated locus B family protein [Aurantiacibacter suaedae]